MDRAAERHGAALPDVRPHAGRRARRGGAGARAGPATRGWSARSASRGSPTGRTTCATRTAACWRRAARSRTCSTAGRFPVLTRVGLLDLHDHVPGRRPPRAGRARAVAGRARGLQHARRRRRAASSAACAWPPPAGAGTPASSPSLEPARVLMCGVRDLDPGERVLVETAGVGYARPSEVVGCAARRDASTCTSTSTCSTPTSCPRSSPVAARAERHRPAHAAGRGRPRLRRRRRRGHRVRGARGPGERARRTELVASIVRALLP